MKYIIITETRKTVYDGYDNDTVETFQNVEFFDDVREFKAKVTEMTLENKDFIAGKFIESTVNVVVDVDTDEPEGGYR